jgi:hypothetical protein
MLAHLARADERSLASFSCGDVNLPFMRGSAPWGIRSKLQSLSHLCMLGGVPPNRSLLIAVASIRARNPGRP